MGVTVWTPREARLGADAEPDAPRATEPEPVALPPVDVKPAAPPKGAVPAVPEAAAASPSTSPGSDATLGWAELRRRVAACVRCGLHSTRTNTVFGVGDEAADWMFIGEAPGADEDAQGEPFVGRSGQL